MPTLAVAPQALMSKLAPHERIILVQFVVIDTHREVYSLKLVGADYLTK